MRQIINAANLNGCRIAQNQLHGCSIRDRIKSLILLLILTLLCTLESRAAEGAVDRSNIGEITAFSGISDIVHSSASINEGMQVGGKVYPMDTLKTGNGSIELVFGINSRIRLGSDTEVLIESVSSKSKIKSNQLFSNTDYRIILKKGVVRVRVRENLVTSTLITLIAGDIKVVAPRSDMVVSRDGSTSQQSYVGIIIAWGRANVNKKNVNDPEWNPNNDKVVSEGYSALVEELDVADDSIAWSMIGLEKARDAVSELPFSVDVNIDGYDEIPEKNPELQGA